MLTETMLSFEAWQNLLISEGGNLPENALEKNKLYETYIKNYTNYSDETAIHD